METEPHVRISYCDCRQGIYRREYTNAVLVSVTVTVGKEYTEGNIPTLYGDVFPFNKVSMWHLLWSYGSADRLFVTPSCRPECPTAPCDVMHGKRSSDQAIKRSQAHECLYT
jgi:hypothetical protein